MISSPATIFVKIHLDSMYMPKADGLRNIVAAVDDLTGNAEGKAIPSTQSEYVAQFIWENIFCRYGAVGQITTDNGPEVQGAVTRLMNRWGIP